MSSQSLYILWDDSQLWGLLAWRAVLGFGLPFRMVYAAEINANLLQKEPPAGLMVPGGSARLKAESLGEAGLESIRNYVRSGGHYLGFCGGAGLGLSQTEPPGTKNSAGHSRSLGLCHWSRAPFEERLQHFMSGHLYASLSQAEQTAISPPLAQEALLPVWWPGRFLPTEGEVAVLARYGQPGPDFWLADLPIASLPPDAFADWKELYGINFAPDFLAGQPCVIHGHYGHGSYTLSYSHLETPASPFANAWLAHMLNKLCSLQPQTALLPDWILENENLAWEDPILSQCVRLFDEITRTGLEHGLLFKRNSWLHGWRAGIPGSQLNNLRSLLHSIAGSAPARAALKIWQQEQLEILELMRLFCRESCHYLLAERLAMTLVKTIPEAVSPEHLSARRKKIFGPPMKAGGIYEKLLDKLDRLMFTQFK